MTPSLHELARHLQPLSQPPRGPGWNRAMLEAMQIPAPQHEAAVLLAIENAEAAPAVLFTLRHDGLAQHPGQVSFPGGRAEADDADAIATALREAHEEIALPPDSVEPLGYLDRLDTSSRFCITPVVARVHGQPSLAAQPGEVAEVFRVPLDYLLEPAHYGHRRIDTPMGQVRISEIRHQGPPIWGVTAMILQNLLQRLGIGN